MYFYCAAIPLNCVLRLSISHVDDKTLLYLAEVLKVQLQELFQTRPPGNRIYDFIEKLETTRF